MEIIEKLIMEKKSNDQVKASFLHCLGRIFLQSSTINGNIMSKEKCMIVFKQMLVEICVNFIFSVVICFTDFEKYIAFLLSENISIVKECSKGSCYYFKWNERFSKNFDDSMFFKKILLSLITGKFLIFF